MIGRGRTRFISGGVNLSAILMLTDGNFRILRGFQVYVRTRPVGMFGDDWRLCGLLFKGSGWRVL